MATIEEPISESSLTGFSHVSLSVSDVERSAMFYEQAFGFDVIDKVEETDFDEWILDHPSGMIVCLQEHHQRGDQAFDPKRTGMDHLAFAVTARGDLDSWAAKLEAFGVAFSPVVDMEGYGAVLCLRDPDDIQLELYWRQS